MWSRTTSNRSQADLVAQLQREVNLKSENAVNAMLEVDRKDFCTVDPYVDAPQTIGYNATISAPHMHAMALSYLSDKLVEGARALDVGSGSGYLTACMAIMVGPTGKVVGIEHMQPLVDMSIKNIRKNHGELFQNGSLTIVHGDGRLGYEDDAPYDAIHVGAAAKEVPKAFFDQLAVGGRMMIPVGGRGGQEFVQYDKVAPDKIEKKRLFGVIYVPLTSADEQWRN